MQSYLGSVYVIVRPKANTIQYYNLAKQDRGYKNICYIILYTFLFALNIPLKLQSIPRVRQKIWFNPTVSTLLTFSNLDLSTTSALFLEGLVQMSLSP